jgi:1,3,6,8-tetrahydroxynaphthalene synthase
MPVLCRPAVHVPEHVITLEETLQLARRLHADHPELALALRLIENTGVQKRHTIVPVEEVLVHPGFEQRNRTYVDHAKACVPRVVTEALGNARVSPEDINAIIFVSCTGFTMPSLTAWLINEMAFPYSTAQIPIAQLGCAAGGAAINRAHDYCVAHPGSNVLIVACEFCSMCYQPTDTSIGSLLSDGLFGDAVAAAVVRNELDGEPGVSLTRNASHLIPDTTEWISYDVRATGFHFKLDRRVPGTMRPLAPPLREFVSRNGWDVADLGFYVVHAGGPRILHDLSRYLDVDLHAFRHSRATLTEYGNVASVVVLDALARMLDDDEIPTGARGLIAGFGPGITAEMSTGILLRPTTPPLGAARRSFQSHTGRYPATARPSADPTDASTS